jgi:hypothetical protein
LKKYHIVPYNTKNNLRKIYRIDKINKKIKFNILKFLMKYKEKHQDNMDKNFDNLNLKEDFIANLNNKIINKYNNRDNSYDNKENNKNKLLKLKIIYEDYLRSNDFKKFLLYIKNKNDEGYLKLFFRHVKNFMNLNFLYKI